MDDAESAQLLHDHNWLCISGECTEEQARATFEKKHHVKPEHVIFSWGLWYVGPIGNAPKLTRYLSPGISECVP